MIASEIEIFIFFWHHFSLIKSQKMSFSKVLLAIDRRANEKKFLSVFGIFYEVIF